MEAKTSKKSYYLPDPLMDLLAEWSRPGRDYSASVAGGVLVWMCLEPEARDAIRKLAYSVNVKNSTGKVKNLLVESLLNAEIVHHSSQVGISKAKLLEILKQAADQGDQHG